MINLSKILDELEQYTSIGSVLDKKELARAAYNAGAIPESFSAKDREFLKEWLDTDGPSDFDRDLDKYNSRLKQVCATKWSWFDLGETSEMANISPEILRQTNDAETLPYQNVALSLTSVRDEKRLNIVIFASRVDNGIDAFYGMTQLVDGKFIMLRDKVSMRKRDGYWEGSDSEANPSDTEKMVEMKKALHEICHVVITTFLKTLRCNNVYVAKDYFPMKLNKKREEKGQRLGYDRHILKIKTNEKEVNVNHGEGSHNSPRLHFRRGHIRRLGDDKYTWVRECMVGSKHGFVDKTYQIGG